MNVNEVPQDHRDLPKPADLHKLVYAVDKDGKYTGVNSAGWDAENTAIGQAWDAIEEDLATTKANVKAGKESPIGYFMKKTLMDTALLARYMGKWQWQIRKHMKPEVFKKLSPDLLTKYAQVFNISVDELTSFGQD